MATDYEYLRKQKYANVEDFLKDYFAADAAKKAGKYPDETDPYLRLRHLEMMDIKTQLWHEGRVNPVKRNLVEALNGERPLVAGFKDILESALVERGIFVDWIEKRRPAVRRHWWQLWRPTGTTPIVA